MPTAAQLQATLTLYETARDQIVAGTVTSVQVEGQSYSFLSLTEIEKQIERYQNRLAVVNATVPAGLGVRGRLGGMGY